MGLLLVIFLAVLTFFVAMAFYYEHPKAKIPHGFSQRRKLYIFHYAVNFGFGLAKVLEKVGITSEVDFLRAVMDGIPPLRDDKQLFIRDLRFEKVEVRIYQPKSSTTGQRRGILYFHGGVGLFGSIKAYERTCRYLARQSNSVVVSVGYRLAPEHPYPTQFEDCLAATIHFMRTAQDYGVDPSRIVICGDSSGGTITAAVAQALVNRQDLPKLRAQILIYPFLQGLDFDLPSYQQNEGVPILLKERTLSLGLKYLNIKLSATKPAFKAFKGNHVPEDLLLKYRKWVSSDIIPPEFKRRGYTPSTTYSFSEEIYALVKPIFDTVFSPLLAEDSVIAQLPEAFILTCEYDVLRDDGLLYKKRLEDHGIKVTWCHLQEGFHGTVLLALSGAFLAFQSGNKGLENIVHFLRLM
ncbi:arylacetamide deacetylase-like 4 [Pezoporus wallicus]|uniref:arylacetamide deacetylase-like 4 n=1 Tax=Pezoporus wallicus TaxID=35540 RepID=UPI00254EDB85|nr:arylacetamide deacetylase-like 4 [Pezoporus wallicus]XP_061335343.1 arylacetamide deacetylase-like 4 [Pezoporus flaviventris]